MSWLALTLFLFGVQVPSPRTIPTSRGWVAECYRTKRGPRMGYKRNLEDL